MTNRIRGLSVATRSLSPVEAEVAVLVESDSITSGTQVRGRLAGPTCPYSTTIEVAYPLTTFAQPLPDAPLARRVIIPEPSPWDPVSPFLYHGIIELWQDGAMSDRTTLRHGLRIAQLGPGGLRWNGKPLKLRVADRAHEGELPQLRQRSFNSLLMDWPAPKLLAAAERLGFVVIARVASPLADAGPGADSAALLGWLLPPAWRAQEPAWRAWLGGQRRFASAVDDGQPMPEWVHFVIGGLEGKLPRLLVDADGELGRIG